MILIDTREPKEFREIILERRPSSIVTTLRDGDDFVVSDGAHTIGFQRKTISDCLGCLASGALDDQLLRLCGNYIHTVLLLEGNYIVNDDNKICTVKVTIGAKGTPITKLFQTGWHAHAFWAKLLSLGEKNGVTIIPTPSLAATADFLIYLDERGGTKGLEHLLM